MRNQLVNANLHAVPASALSIVALQRPFGPRFLLSPDDPAPTPAPAIDPSPAPAPAPAPSPAPGPQPPVDGSVPYRPEGLPDHLFGASDRETIDKLNGAYVGARNAISAQGAVPEKADGYTFDASDKLKPYVANFDKDPVYQKAREFALASGMTAKAFGTFMPSLLEHLVDGGLVAAPIDPKAQLRALAPANMASASDAEKEVAGGRRVQDNIAWADGAKASQSIDPEIADFLSASAADSAAANKLIEWMRSANNETLPAMGSGSSGLSQDQMTARMNDPRNDPRSPQYDKSFAIETDNLSKKHYG